MGDDLGGAGVVDEDVESAVVLDGPGHEVPGLLVVGDVGLDVAGAGKLRRQGLARFDRRGRVDHHGGSLRGEGPGRGRPDAARRSGHEGDLALQASGHRRSPSLGRAVSDLGWRRAVLLSGCRYGGGMRLVSFVEPDAPSVLRTGVVVDEDVVDLTDPSVALPGDMTEFLVAGPAAMERADDATTVGRPSTAARRRSTSARRCPTPPRCSASGSTTPPTWPRPGRPRPEYQVWFNKQRTCVIGPGDAIEIPRVSAQVDYEGELAMVIGRRCRHVPAAEAAVGRGRLHDPQRRDRARLAVAHARRGRSGSPSTPTGPRGRGS